MSAVFEKKENNKVSFSFQLAAEDFEKAVQQAYLRNRSKFNIPGFRREKPQERLLN